MRSIRPRRSVAILAALILVTALGQAGAAATGPGGPARSGTVAASNCDPNDLPGESEGPDDDGDECNFTISGQFGPPKPNNNPDDEFATGSPTVAKKCSVYRFVGAEAIGIEVANLMFNTGGTTGADWMLHFLSGSGTAINLGPDSSLASDVQASPVFKKYNDRVQMLVKQQLDQGVQDVKFNTIGGTLNLPFPPDFYAKTIDTVFDPGPFWAFGGTQGVKVTGNGFPQHGQYIGEITYTISDIFGFKKNDRIRYFGPAMHYLQGTCGAPYHKGGAHWFPDSVTFKVKFQQPIG